MFEHVERLTPVWHAIAVSIFPGIDFSTTTHVSSDKTNQADVTASQGEVTQIQGYTAEAEEAATLMQLLEQDKAEAA